MNRIHQIDGSQFNKLAESHEFHWNFLQFLSSFAQNLTQSGHVHLKFECKYVIQEVKLKLQFFPINFLQFIQALKKPFNMI